MTTRPNNIPFPDIKNMPLKSQYSLKRRRDGTPAQKTPYYSQATDRVDENELLQKFLSLNDDQLLSLYTTASIFLQQTLLEIQKKNKKNQ
jgi:hypothetical protein